MKNKKTIAKRLMALYISFILVIALAFVGNFISEFSEGYNAGYKVGRMRLDSNDGNYNNVFLLPRVPLEANENIIPLSLDDSQFHITAYGDHISLIVEESLDEQTSPFRSVGDHPAYYVTMCILGIAFIWLLVLIGLIIRSVRRSMIEEQSIERSNVRRVRWIAAILIGSELIGTLLTWRMNLQAAELLEGSGLSVDTTFSPDYLIIMLGVLILFMGELFAITHSLSEEQKLTV
ncbi:MAG: DUF2975 domain-containing protein [Rikenellaceae bacterium]